jgi:hypothetical protein
MAITEEIYISEFNVQRTGSIGVRKTTDVVKDGEIIATSYWRTVLAPNDPEAATVLNEQYYLDIATYAWTQTPPAPTPPPPEGDTP